MARWEVIQRSDDGRKTWNPVGNRFVYDGVAVRISGTTARRITGVRARLAFRTVAETIRTPCAGVEDAALFRSTDGCCAARSATTSRNVAAPSSAPSLANEAYRTTSPTHHSPERSPAEPSLFWLWAPWPAVID